MHIPAERSARCQEAGGGQRNGSKRLRQVEMPADTSPRLPSLVLVSLHGPCASVPTTLLLQIFPWGGGRDEGRRLNLFSSLLCSRFAISYADLTFLSTSFLFV